MSVNIGINGFGRMGKLIMRVIAEWPELNVIKINDINSDSTTTAHLFKYDSVHGISPIDPTVNGEQITIAQHKIEFSSNQLINDTDWSACDIVIDATGKHKTIAKLEDYYQQGVKKVLVTAPVKEEGALNIVMGVNHHLYETEKHRLITAASCTTNCLAPVVKVLHEQIGIEHGSMTTIHDITNTQTILDKAHKDLRRARACGMSLIPTTTGSATAITHIFPELKGRLNGHAIRIPLANASLTDCVFEMRQDVTVEQVNNLFRQAAETDLEGILGYEEKPLVSIDYKTDPRSCIIDALSTMVINGRQLKIYAWYDNEWGYVNRTAELCRLIAESL